MLSSTYLPRSICSPTVPSLYRGRAVFSRLEKTSLRREISLTSLCLDTTQKPPSSNPPTPSGCSFHQIGAVRRSSASSSTGNRSAWMSGSVKSNPGGRLGGGLVVGSHGDISLPPLHTRSSSRTCARKPLVDHGWEGLRQDRRTQIATCSLLSAGLSA